jgi:TatD DNase family protein
MRLFDTHCHLDVVAAQRPLAPALAEAVAVGVRAWIIPAIDPPRWEAVGALSAPDEGRYVALGIHPQVAGALGDDALDEALGRLPEALRRHGAVAVGEIGLDFHRHRDEAARARQRRAFARQLAIGGALGLPCLIHDVKAHAETLAALRARPVRGAPGVLHAYGGGAGLVAAFAREGMWFGFGGAVGWPEARRAPEACAAIPPGRLLLETDAPWQAPAARRGEPCAPADLALALEAVAAARAQAPAAVAEATWEAACALFQLRPRCGS